VRVRIAKIGGLPVVALCWYGARTASWNNTWAMAFVWCVPLLTFPIAVLARRALDAEPTANRGQWVTVLAHYATMIALGTGIFRAFRLAKEWPGAETPVPQELSLALVILTSIATGLTVLNLAWRGLGAPFAVKLSSRLATDWMYRWTRNPMVLCTLPWLFSLGLMYRSLWVVVWLAVSVTPGWIFFVRRYEERELQIRFGDSYDEYRRRTPFLWPRRPRAAGPSFSQKSAGENRAAHVRN